MEHQRRSAFRSATPGRQALGARRRPSLILNVLLAYGTGSNAMIIIVEIVSRSGTRACKEYDVPTFGSAIAAAERELRGYSDFRLVDVRTKDECPEASGKIGST